MRLMQPVTLNSGDLKPLFSLDTFTRGHIMTQGHTEIHKQKQTKEILKHGEAIKY